MTLKRGQHEDFGRERPVGPGSTRGFAWVMAGAFGVIGAVVAWRYGIPYWWFVVVAVAFVAVELVAGALLEPLNRGWFKLGQLLGRVISPLVLGLVFLLAVTPTGLLRRLLGKRSFPVDFDPDASTYWEPREPPGPNPETLPRQF